MSKFIPKEANPGYWLKKVMPKTPSVNIPETVVNVPETPRTPEAPPAPQEGANQTQKDNKRRTGYKSNLFTGGSGLGNINSANLLKKVLGSKLGLSS